MGKQSHIKFKSSVWKPEIKVGIGWFSLLNFKDYTLGFCDFIARLNDN